MAIALAALDAAEARVLTDEVKDDAAALWGKLLRLYEGGAHTALGYSSWADYCRDEFDMGKRTAYRMLDAAAVVESVSHGTLEPPASERVARELVPVLRDNPEQVQEVWAEVVQEHGPEPTAAQVQEKVRHKLDVHTSSATPEWETPQAFFDLLDAEFGFELDVCASAGLEKCDRYFSPADDGLAQRWEGICWMNPPYGDEIPKWVEKARREAELGATVVALVPARIDTRWWRENCTKGEIRFLAGRLKFGGADTSAPFPSAVVIFGREPNIPASAWWDWREAT